jgi:uncharacterized protein (DUF3820 family)
MTSQDKRQPALTDTDPMPFGKYKGTPMQDVPATYLRWLKNEGCTNVVVANYIHNSWDAIQMELGDD